ncbi:DUF3489 domain-containing protein [Sediminicoccus sp. BL-A-41-H5]|uniref:DUF3489 domain-containing protein n=1 Tax=Sediminicoccus sp. BL-A-41-H5 TaxID=3421106 RepID=UPI003D67A820
MTQLSDTQRVILSAAAQHEMGLARAPKTLPAAARNAVFRSLIKNNLLTEINAPRDFVGLGWRQDEDGTWIVARITDEGLRAIGIDPNDGDAVAHTAPTAAPDATPGESPAPAADPAQAAPLTEEIALLDQVLAERAATPRASLRDTAAAILAAWDDQAARFGTHEGDLTGALDAPIAALRAALASKPTHAPRDANTPRKPREGTKQEQVLAMLRRPEGATVAQIAEGTGWNNNTVRGFLASLKKKGHAVEVMERIRQVGPNKEGARGSFTIYRIAE